MASMNIFESDAFSMLSLTNAFNRIPFQPTMLGSMPGLITPRPIRHKSFYVEERNGVLTVLQTSERGAPIHERTTEKRNVRNFSTARIAIGDTINAEEIQDIRAFGSESEMMQVQSEVVRRYSGPNGILRDIEITEEHMRLGMIQGIVLDADGSTLTNWFDEWGIAQPAAVNFALTTAGTKVRGKCMTVRRAMRQAAKGSWVDGRTQVHALCGDTFFDNLIDHPLVRDTYQNWAAAADLRQNLEYESFPYGGIMFHNYRGTDDFVDDSQSGTAGVGIDANEAKFFPVNAPGVFEHVLSPAEFMPFVNTPGQRVYGMNIMDRDRQAWTRVEAYTYPMFVCTRPGMLQRATGS